MSDVAGERLEVGDDQIRLPFVDQVLQMGQAPGGLRDCDQVLRDGALVAHTIVDVSEVEAVNLGDVEVRLQILQAAIKGSHVNGVSLGDEMREHFFGAGRVARAFAVDSIKNVSHVSSKGEYTAARRRLSCGTGMFAYG